MNLKCYKKEDVMMKKPIFLVLEITFIGIIIMMSVANSWSQNFAKGQIEETIFGTVSNAGTLDNKSDGVQGSSNNKNQTEERFILFSGKGSDSGENALPPEVNVIIQEIDDGFDEQPYYIVLVELNTGYISSQNWEVAIINKEEEFPQKFEISKGQIDYRITSSETGLLTRRERRSIDGRLYCIESTSEGAAGTIYTQYEYFTMKNGSLITVSCVIRYPRCMNYSEPYRSECENERENFNLDRIIDFIVKNLRIERAKEKQ